ncbi:4292_t:CDS:1 [Dentiscutata erythropus]|nr:4292_t:CDS:1 [Dentiscutata erythropus]
MVFVFLSKFTNFQIQKLIFLIIYISFHLTITTNAADETPTSTATASSLSTATNSSTTSTSESHHHQQLIQILITVGVIVLFFCLLTIYCCMRANRRRRIFESLSPSPRSSRTLIPQPPPRGSYDLTRKLETSSTDTRTRYFDGEMTQVERPSFDSAQLQAAGDEQHNPSNIDPENPPISESEVRKE